MEYSSIDYRGNTPRAARDIRTRLKMAGPGHVINIICNEEQLIRLLREITYNDGVITAKEIIEQGVHLTIRKT